MTTPLPKLESVFPQWRTICDKYDAICARIPQTYPSEQKAAQKEESIHWEQTAFELIITLLISARVPFETSDNNIQKIVKSTSGVDKEIDFSIHVKSKEIYFGVTSFSDSEKDFSKDVNDTSIDISDVEYSDGTVSDAAKIISVRPHGAYLNRRLVVRVAKEGKHILDSDYIYIVFPKRAAGFGGGLDAISKDFSFSNSKSSYIYPNNGITGLIIVGEYVNIQSNKMFIEHGVWLVKTIAFPHASSTVGEILAQMDNTIVDMRPKFQEVRNMLANDDCLG